MGNLGFKSAQERKLLVGKDVVLTMMSGRKRAGRVLLVAGRNMEMDFGGSRDWVWVPDIFEIAPAEKSSA